VGRGIYAKSSPHVVVLRSTVPPGVSQEVVIPLLERFSRRRLGDGLEYHFHPEFLRTGSALNDVEAPPLIVIGERGGGSAVLLRNLYHASSVPINVTSYKTAEAVKLLSNAFHAVKITFANEAGAALAEVGVDAREAFDLLCADASLNISPSYLGRGFAFGGPCLPKDLAAFVQLAEGFGVAVPFLASLPAANKTVASRALELIDPQPGRSIVLFGLAFKPGTADVRDSPYATLALELVAKGCKLRIIDSLVRLAWAARPESPPEDYRCLAGLMAEDIVSEVADAETVVLGHVSPQDLYLLNQNLDGKFVVDLAPNPQLTLRRGPNYRGLCW
jgi:GDP-mannose 6-dehydrogenase